MSLPLGCEAPCVAAGSAPASKKHAARSSAARWSLGAVTWWFQLWESIESRGSETGPHAARARAAPSEDRDRRGCTAMLRQGDDWLSAVESTALPAAARGDAHGT